MTFMFHARGRHMVDVGQGLEVTCDTDSCGVRLSARCGHFKRILASAGREREGGSGSKAGPAHIIVEQSVRCALAWSQVRRTALAYRASLARGGNSTNAATANVPRLSVVEKTRPLRRRVPRLLASHQPYSSPRVASYLWRGKHAMMLRRETGGATS